MTIEKSVCIFCGSKSGRGSSYGEAAQKLGALLGEKKLRMVYGGGNIGLMGLTAEACLSKGGKVIGIIPESLMEREGVEADLYELRVVQTMHERKAQMEKLSDIVIALPGGFGTLDELNEIITWRQLNFHQMPIFLLNIGGYFDYFLKFIDRAVEEGFISHEHRDYLKVCDSVEELAFHL